MVRTKKTPAVVVPVEHYLEGVAKSLVDRIYGPDGPAWGTKMSELEDVVVAVREALSEKMLARALDQQAQTVSSSSAEYHACPTCGGPVDAKPDAKPRDVLTRGGNASWDELHTTCRKCRRAFFPSEQKFGH